jgi:hypothetical protein
MDPTVVRTIITLGADPGLKSATPLGRDKVHCGAPVFLVKSVKMPLAEVPRMVAGIVEKIGNSLLPLRERVFMSRHHVVWVAARQHRPSKRTARGNPRSCLVEVSSGLSKPVDIRCVYVWISIGTDCLCAPLVCNQPDHIWDAAPGFQPASTSFGMRAPAAIICDEPKRQSRRFMERIPLLSV